MMKNKYNNLRAEMIRNGVTVDDIAKCLEVSPKTVRNKINGETQFSWEEVKKIKKLLKTDLPLEELFKNSKNGLTTEEKTQKAG